MKDLNVTHALCGHQYGLPVVEPETVGMCSERLARIKPVMMKFVDEGQAPGFVTAIARRGELVHYEAMGYMDVASRRPMLPDAIFRLHSQTKPVVGVATMMLFEEGHFGLNDPIAAYLPEFSEMEILQDDGSRVKARPITIKHLMTHTAGLSYYLYPETPVGKMYVDAGLVTNSARLNGTTCEQYVKKIASLPLIAQPGTIWSYSEAMTVLGRLIEVISGRSLGEFLKQRLFTPLGMVDTNFYVPPEKIDRLATQYMQAPDGGLVEVPKDDISKGDYASVSNDFSRPPSYEGGGSGLVGTAPDYLRFAQMLLNGGELDGERFLSPLTVDCMMSNHLGPEFGEAPLAAMGNYAWSTPGIGFGFCGLVVTDIVASGSTGSNGEYSWGGGASTDFWIDRRQNLIGLVMTQLLVTGCIPSRERMHQMTYQGIVNSDWISSSQNECVY